MCILLHRSNLSNLAHFRHKIVDDFLAQISEFLGFLLKFAVFRTYFDEIFSELHEPDPQTKVR